MKFIVKESKKLNYLDEGVYDPGILKAVFMAGGPGSGKSRIASELFSIPRGVLSSVSPSGLKLVNTDPAFEKFLKDAGIDPKKLSELSPEEFEELTIPAGSPRQRARRLRDIAVKGYQSGRLGMIIDGTGENFEKISRKKRMLDLLGYDTYMVFVNTDLDVALERNQLRDRRLPDDLVERTWRAVRRNMGRYQELFTPANFLIVDNTDREALPEYISKAVNRFLREPISNDIGKQWIKDQLKQKDSQGDTGAEMKITKERLAKIIKEEIDKDEKIWSSFRDKYKEVIGVKPRSDEMPDDEEELKLADKALSKLKKKDKEKRTKREYKKLLNKEKDKKEDKERDKKEDKREDED